jgi:hypothetical protein
MRERARGPEQHRERMRELPDEGAHVPAALAAADLVRAVLLQPPLGLSVGEPAGAGAQLAQQQIERLRGIDLRRSLTLGGDDERTGHRDPGVQRDAPRTA